MTTFTVKTPDIRNLEKFYKKAPKKFARASAGMLNNLAFQTRGAALIRIASDLAIRNPRFVASRMQVEKAKSGPMSGQRAEAGSVAKDRFSGWTEQETGAEPLRNRVFTLTARRGNNQNQAAPSSRLKPGNNIVDINDLSIAATGRMQRRRIFIQMMSRRPNKPFIMRRKYKKMRRGVYVFKGKRLLQLQAFDRMTVKRKPWMKPARASVMTRGNVRAAWAKSIKFVLR